MNFAVVRDTVPLDLRRGINTVRFDGVTAFVEAEYNVICSAPVAACRTAGGRSFENARVKLMAGDVAKLAPRSLGSGAGGGVMGGIAGGIPAAMPPVTEKAFDECTRYRRR